jgi:hypothetical protein
MLLWLQLLETGLYAPNTSTVDENPRIRMPHLMNHLAGDRKV